MKVPLGPNKIKLMHEESLSRLKNTNLTVFFTAFFSVIRLGSKWSVGEQGYIYIYIYLYSFHLFILQLPLAILARDKIMVKEVGMVALRFKYVGYCFQTLILLRVSKKFQGIETCCSTHIQLGAIKIYVFKWSTASVVMVIDKLPGFH